MVGQEEVDLDKKYKMVTNDFIAAGGDGYVMFDGKAFVGEGGLLSDVLIEYVEEKTTVNPQVEGRIIANQEPVDSESSREDKEYVVKSGDWLARIGKMYGIDWPVLAHYNSLKNPHLIYPDQIIRIPQQIN